MEWRRLEKIKRGRIYGGACSHTQFCQLPEENLGVGPNTFALI